MAREDRVDVLVPEGAAGVVKTGTSSNEKIGGTKGDDILFGEGGNDVVRCGAGDDRIHGGGGDDILRGNAGNDTIFGAATAGGSVDMDKFRIFEDVKGTVTFNGESAGFKNTLGMYKISESGEIYDVQILFANASLRGSGGNLVAGQSSVDVDLKAGDQVGFFVVPNAYSQRGMSQLLNDENAQFKFVGKDGGPANVNDGTEIKLVQVNEKGVETIVKSQYGDSVFHSFGGADGGLNGDKFNHVTGDIDTATGSIKIGFEDLKGGGDKDFDDSVFTFNIGQTNTALLPKEDTGIERSSDDDKIAGGKGDDDLFGMSGDDVVRGGSGDDRIWGNSGDDKLFGGKGDDEVRGGSGDDKLAGNKGNDYLDGNSGDDFLSGGAGDDELWGNSGNDTFKDGRGNDKSFGGSGDDVFLAGAGNDYYQGGSGFDTLDFSQAKQGITADLSKHIITGFGKDEVWSVEKLIGSNFDDVIKGDKRANEIVGGDGDDQIRGLGGADVFTGGAGNDVYTWMAKDVVDQKTGEHLGVDRITDFEKGDTIDIRKILNDQDADDLSELVKVTDGEKGAMVSVSIEGEFVDVVIVEGVSSDDLLSDGLILA